MGIRFIGVMSGLLLVGACSSDDVGAGVSTGVSTGGATQGTSGGTTGEPGTTELADSGSGVLPGTTEMGEVDPCEKLRELPPAPVDCSGADGVLLTDVVIDDSPQSDDPSILEGVRRVEGSIIISRTALTNLDFMACVEEVTGEINIFDNDALTNVHGLWSLDELGTDFKLSQNDALVDFDGLPNLSKVVVNVIITENAALETISGFHRLVELEGDTLIDDMGEEVFFGGNLTIQQNPVLTNIDGLVGLQVIRGVFAVTNNPVLCSISVANVWQCIVEPAEPPPSWPAPPDPVGC